MTRQATNRILEMVECGLLDKDQVILACLKYMSEDEVADMAHANEFFFAEENEDEKYARTCSECGKGMNEGYCFDGGRAYYCSDECLHKHFTPEEWEELYDDGEGDSYWTEWEDEDDEEF